MQLAGTHTLSARLLHRPCNATTGSATLPALAARLGRTSARHRTYFFYFGETLRQGLRTKQSRRD